uniref:Uncharacterized protein n=1 Tax=Ananas comosus var. bracteatus TaxID=296719 RepID=A0A6V7PHH7_ANACO|nr:unnamed protein product [Ananas comosus var. bracteatus]
MSLPHGIPFRRPIPYERAYVAMAISGVPACGEGPSQACCFGKVLASIWDFLEDSYAIGSLPTSRHSGDGHRDIYSPCGIGRRSGLPWARLIPRVGMLTTTGPLGSAPARQPTEPSAPAEARDRGKGVA